MASARRPSLQFQNANELYFELVNELREFSSLHISDKLLAFFNGYSNLQNRNPEMARKIEEVAIEYQEIEVEAQKYVAKAKNFAQGNKILAQNVLDGKQYYRPESILKNFKRTAENLDEAFTDFVKKHSEVERSIASISYQAKDAGRQAGRLATNADKNVLCNVPVAGVVVAPGVKAAQWINRVDHLVAKSFAGLAGFVAGILQGAISTALLGIPACAAAEATGRLQRLQEMYESIAETLKKSDQLVKKHKKLLTNISACVSQLLNDYEEFGEEHKSETLELYQIELFKNTCDNIIEACDMYLTTFPLK